MHTNRKSARAGFTLAELMVVIVIIGLLATLVVPNVVRKLFVANVTKAKADIVNIASAIESYVIENGGRYPDSIEVLITEDENGYKILDRDTVPLDPWGNPYVYEPPQPGSQKFRIISYGKDGIPGGEGDEGDLDNIKIKNNER